MLGLDPFIACRKDSLGNPSRALSGPGPDSVRGCRELASQFRIALPHHLMATDIMARTVTIATSSLQTHHGPGLVPKAIPASFKLIPRSHHCPSQSTEKTEQKMNATDHPHYCFHMCGIICPLKCICKPHISTQDVLPSFVDVRRAGKHGGGLVCVIPADGESGHSLHMLSAQTKSMCFYILFDFILLVYAVPLFFRFLCFSLWVLSMCLLFNTLHSQVWC